MGVSERVMGTLPRIDVGALDSENMKFFKIMSVVKGMFTYGEVVRSTELYKVAYLFISKSAAV